MTYPIIENIGADAPAHLDISEVTATMKQLDINAGFVIPAADLAGEDGKYLSSSVGQRIHQAARRLGIKISIKKKPEGLRIKRVE